MAQLFPHLQIVIQMIPHDNGILIETQSPEMNAKRPYLLRTGQNSGLDSDEAIDVEIGF